MGKMIFKEVVSLAYIAALAVGVAYEADQLVDLVKVAVSGNRQEKQ